jgi:hypothetical protein
MRLASQTSQNNQTINLYRYATLQTLSGKIPYHSIGTAIGVLRAILDGERPSCEPTQSSDGTSYNDIWEIASDGWKANPSLRPNMEIILTRLLNASLPHMKDFDSTSGDHSAQSSGARYMSLLRD